MGLILFKALNRLVANLRSFTPAKIREWRAFILIFGFVVFLVAIAIALLVLVLIYAGSELHRMGYTPWFFLLLMKLLGWSRQCVAS